MKKKYTQKKKANKKNQAEIKSLELINIEFQERIILKTNILIKHSKNLKFIIPHKNLLQNNIFIENIVINIE